MEKFFLICAMHGMIFSDHPLFRPARNAVVSPAYFADYRAADGLAAAPPPVFVEIQAWPGDYMLGCTFTYRVYPWRILNGTRYYSPSYMECTAVDLYSGHAVTYSQIPADGFRILQKVTGPGVVQRDFDYYLDITAANPEGLWTFIDTDPARWTAGNTVTPSSLFVLPDRSGNRRHLFKTGAGAAPTVLPTGWFNGAPCLRFTGAGGLCCDAFAAQPSITMMLAFRLTSLNQTHLGVVDGATGARNSVRTTNPTASPFRRFATNSGSAIWLNAFDAQQTNPNFLTVVFSAGSGTIETGTSSAFAGGSGLGTEALTKIIVGLRDTLDNGALMDFAGLRVWNRVLSVAEKDYERGVFAGYYLSSVAVPRKLMDGTARLLQDDSPLYVT